MGTPSYIAKQIGADSYLTIYCQIEGHLRSTGYLLDKYYNTPEQVDALLALGDIYSVESTLNPDNRNYGKTGKQASVMDIDTLLDNEDFAEYLYIFTQDNRWKFLCLTTEEMELKDVKDALQADNQRVFDPNVPHAWLKAKLQNFLAPGENSETLPIADGENSDEDLVMRM